MLLVQEPHLGNREPQSWGLVLLASSQGPRSGDCRHPGTRVGEALLGRAVAATVF